MRSIIFPMRNKIKYYSSSGFQDYYLSATQNFIKMRRPSIYHFTRYCSYTMLVAGYYLPLKMVLNTALISLVEGIGARGSII